MDLKLIKIKLISNIIWVFRERPYFPPSPPPPIFTKSRTKFRRMRGGGRIFGGGLKENLREY